MSKIMRQELNAVFDDDLLPMLEQLGLLTKFNNGKINCKFCRDVITEENLASLLKQSGEIKFICDKQECLQKIYMLIRLGEVTL